MSLCVMKTASHSHGMLKRIVLGLILVVPIAVVALVCLLVGTFIVHFLWTAMSHSPTQSEVGSPGWLVLPSFLIGGILLILLNKWTGLIGRLLVYVKRHA